MLCLNHQILGMHGIAPKTVHFVSCKVHMVSECMVLHRQIGPHGRFAFIP